MSTDYATTLTEGCCHHGWHWAQGHQRGWLADQHQVAQVVHTLVLALNTHLC